MFIYCVTQFPYENHANSVHGKQYKVVDENTTMPYIYLFVYYDIYRLILACSHILPRTHKMVWIYGMSTVLFVCQFVWLSTKYAYTYAKHTLFYRNRTFGEHALVFFGWLVAFFRSLVPWEFQLNDNIARKFSFTAVSWGGGWAKGCV